MTKGGIATMRARKARSFQPGANSAGDRRLRKEIEADVFEIWVGVSRLMSRLCEPDAPFKTGRRPAQRRRSGGPRSRSA
jgi:hypothetical protein